MTILLPTLHRSTSTPSLTKNAATTASLGKKSGGTFLGPLLELIRHPSEHLPGFELTAEEKQHQLLQAKLKNATNYDDWYDAASKLDELEGNEEWKQEPTSPDYDSHLVQARLEQLRSAMQSGDLNRMLFLVRTTLTRGLGDMGNAKLYRHSYTGTKHLIEAYIETTLEVLDTILNSPRSSRPGLSPKKILEGLISTRQSFGRTALLLSGGATLGMNHVGVIKTLYEADLLPRIVSGASAGAIVASVLCTRTDDEIPYTLDVFPYGDLDVFGHTKPGEGMMDRVARFLKIGAWIDIGHLTRVMRDMLGDMTFHEAYNRTRRILNICVSPASVYELPKLLNYITAPNVLVWSAVVASCSVPFLFTATTIMAKDPKTGLEAPWNPSPRTWIDGSVDNDLPMTRLAEMFNVNHFIVSQVNPHVIPFIDKEEANPSQAHEESSSSSSGQNPSTWKGTLVQLAVGEALHGMNMLSEIGIFRTSLTKARSILSQKYAGDITIFPEVTMMDFPSLLKTPTTQFMLDATLRGERATWPRLSRIRNHCAIELALDRVIHHMRTKVVFSPSQTDLRLGGWIPTGVYALAGGKMVNGNGVGFGSNAAVRGRGGTSGRRRRMRSNDPNDAGGSLNAFIGEQKKAQQQQQQPVQPLTSPTSLPRSPSEMRLRSRSSGPVRWGLGGDMTSPILTRMDKSGGGGDYFNFDASSSANAGSGSSRTSSISMTPIKPNSPNVAHKRTDEEGTLQRSGSRFRLVRQTPTAELDPADADDESAAVLGSSEEDEPLPETLELYQPNSSSVSPSDHEAGADEEEDSFDDEGLEMDVIDHAHDEKTTTRSIDDAVEGNPLSLRRTSSMAFSAKKGTKSAPGSLRLKMPQGLPAYLLSPGGHDGEDNNKVTETTKGGGGLLGVGSWFSGLPMRSPGSGFGTPTGVISPPPAVKGEFFRHHHDKGGVGVGVGGEGSGNSPLSASSLRNMLFMTPRKKKAGK